MNPITKQVVAFLQAGTKGEKFADHAIQSALEKDPPEFEESVATLSVILSIWFSKFAVDPIDDRKRGAFEDFRLWE